MSKERDFRDGFRRLLVVHGVFDKTTRPCGVPLSAPHAHALLELVGAAAPLTVTDLATRLRIDRTNVSRLCQRMETLGELERVPHAEDGRAKVLRLTEKGRTLAEHVDLMSSQHFARVLEFLGEDVEDVLVVLKRIESAMNQVSEVRRDDFEKKGENE